MNEHNINYLTEALEITPEEARIYVHLLENGPSTPLLVSRNTSVNRTKVYRVLENLEEMSLVNKTTSDRGQAFTASNPETIAFILDEKEREINKKRELMNRLINELNSLTPQRKVGFEVKPFRGVEGMKQLLFNETQHSHIMVIGRDSVESMVGKPFAESIRQRAVDNDIHYKEILNTEYATIRGRVEDYTKVPGFERQIEERYIEKEMLDTTQSIQIYGDNVSIIQWIDGTYTGTEISNKDHSDYERQIFKLLWQKAKSYREVLGLE